MEAEETSKTHICETEVEIKNEHGLHMAAAMQFIDVSNLFKSKITVNDGKNIVDGKSILEVSMLFAPEGSRLKIKARGHDSDRAIDALQKLVEERVFDESPL